MASSDGQEARCHSVTSPSSGDSGDGVADPLRIEATPGAVRGLRAFLGASGRSGTSSRGARALGKIDVLMKRIIRVQARFREIARSDGVGAACSKAGMKLAMKLNAYRRILPAWFGSGRCPYFTPPPRLDPYEAWRRVNQDNPRRRRRIEAALRPCGPRPRFSILVPTYRPGVNVFEAMIESVIRQTYGGWELILVANGCPDPRLPGLMDEWSRRDPRIKALHRAVNGNISAATNQAADAALGDYLVLLDSDDLLDPDALAHAGALSRRASGD